MEGPEVRYKDREDQKADTRTRNLTGGGHFTDQDFRQKDLAFAMRTRVLTGPEKVTRNLT